MNDQQPSDAELAERLARGDWAHEVEGPDLGTVTTLVTQRRRRRRAAYVGGAGAAAAAVVALVVALQPFTSNNDGSRLPEATRPVESTSTPDPTAALPDCSRGSRLVVTYGPLGGTAARPTKQVYLGNLSSGACMLRSLPTLSVDLPDGPRTTVDMPSGIDDDGPWQLRPDRGLLFTVKAPPPASCMRGTPLSTELTLSYQGYEYSSPFKGMRVLNCAPPVLSDLRVGPSPGG